MAPFGFVLIDSYNQLKDRAVCSSAVLCAGAAAEDMGESMCCLEMASHRSVF